MTNRCLVIGANGFLGSHLAKELLESGCSVRAFDRDPTRLADHVQLESMVGDFLNRGDLNTALKDIDYVFHMVSTTTPIVSDDDPFIDIDTNLRMSVELFELCSEAGIKKIIFPSTGGAIYGDNPKQSLSENDVPHPLSPYGIAKLAIEQYLRYFERKNGLKSIVYRISNPYGEGQNPAAKQGVIPIFMQHIKKGEPITVYGDGSMSRDYIYVKDVARMIVGSYEQDNQHLVYNLGSGQGRSINEVIEAIESTTGKQFERNRMPVPKTFLAHSQLDTTRFSEEFGLEPATDLQAGITETWKYIESME